MVAARSSSRAVWDFCQRHPYLSVLYLFVFGYVLAGFSQWLHPSHTLFGRRLLISLSALLMTQSVLAGALLWLERRGVDAFARSALAVAALLSLHYLHISANGTYTNDVGGHWNHIAFIYDHW